MKLLNSDIFDARLEKRDESWHCVQLDTKRNWTIRLIFLSALVTLVTVITLPTVVRDIQNDLSRSKLSSRYKQGSSEEPSEKVLITNRLGWLAQPQVGPMNELMTPVSLVMIYETATEPCRSQENCIYQARQIQTFHIESNHWSDIGYNFLVGGDGYVYEGRGWKKEGAPTIDHRARTIGVAFIGTFELEAPQEDQLRAFWELMEKGVELGYLSKGYRIVAARQLKGISNPGTAFFEKAIKKWPKWAKKA